jgi:arylsulfatase A-like enzyme
VLNITPHRTPSESFRLGALVFAALLTAHAFADTAPALPNFVLCMTDDQGWGDVGYNGHEVLKTPNLDSMAESGVRLDRFYAAQHNCSPTRASVLTGRHPDRCRTYAWGHDLPLREVTIAEVAQARGYATGHFGKWHLGGLPNGDGGDGRGFSPGAETGMRHPGLQGFSEWFSAGNFFDYDPPAGALFHSGKTVGALRGESSDIVMGEALKFIRAQAKTGKPFLAVVWFPSPHWPYRALAADKAPYANETNADFLGEVAAIDRAMGRLRDDVKALGLRDNTLIWFNSDNGAAGGSSGGLSGVKGTLLEGGIRVPGIIEWPGRVRGPLRTSVPASTVDIFPTLCAAMGLPPQNPECIDGISLLPLLDGNMVERPRPIGFQSSDTRTAQPIDAAWIDGKWKLLRLGHPQQRGKDEADRPMAPGDRLFDLGSDPTESRDCSAMEPEVYARMKAALDQWQASVASSAAEYPFTPPKQPPVLALGGKARHPILDDALRSPNLRERWIEGDGTRFDQHWDFSDSALRGREPHGDRLPAGCGVPLRQTDSLISVAIKLDGARAANVEVGSFSRGHIARVVVSPAGVALHVHGERVAGRHTPGADIIAFPAAIEAGEWHTLLWELRGSEAVLSMDGRQIGRASHPKLLSVKDRFGFSVVGQTASFRDLCIWDTSDPLE